jgi:hypothetical protein
MLRSEVLRLKQARGLLLVLELEAVHVLVLVLALVVTGR